MRLLALLVLLPIAALAQTESATNGSAPAPTAPRTQYITESAPAPTRPSSATTTPAATARPAPRPAAAATPVASTPVPAPTPVAAPAAATATPVIALPGQAAIAPTAPTLTLEQRRQQELLANAGKLDQANRDLLAKNQLMQLEIEKLATQVNVLKNDRSNEGIRNGALAVIAGFLLGWFFASLRGGNKGSSW